MSLLSDHHLDRLDRWIDHGERYDHLDSDIVSQLRNAVLMARCARPAMDFERLFDPAQFTNPGPWPTDEVTALEAALVTAGADPDS